MLCVAYNRDDAPGKRCIYCFLRCRTLMNALMTYLRPKLRGRLVGFRHALGWWVEGTLGRRQPRSHRDHRNIYTSGRKLLSLNHRVFLLWGRTSRF